MADNAISYGFINLEDQFARRVQEVGVQRVFTALEESAAEHTRVINAMTAGFATRTTVAQEQYELPGAATLQPMDESGVPKPIVTGGSYQVAYPIQGGGIAYGFNRVTRAMATVQEVNSYMITTQNADADWLARHMIAALLDNTSWTFEDKVGPNGSRGLGNITIQPLANGDTVTYVKNGMTAPSTDNHYYAQAAAIADAANPFPTIMTELHEHPGQRGAPVVAYISSSLVTSVTGLATFVEAPDPDITEGSGSDRLINSIQRGFGDEVLGKIKGGPWVVEWSKLPSGYGIAQAVGHAPLKMREYPAPELQGLFPENFSPDGNHNEARMLRYAGFGVGNRVAAVVFQIGNATYQIPSGWETPLPY